MYENWMLTFKAQSQSLRERVGLNLQEISTALGVGEASGGGEGVILRVHLPQPQVSGKGLLKTDLLQPSCVACAECLQAASGDCGTIFISGGQGTEESR